MKRRIRNNGGFSVTELLAIVFVLLISAAYFLPTGGRAKANPKRIRCVNNLQQIGLGYRIFATDHNDLFPWEAATNAPPPKTFEDVLIHFRTLSNEIANPNILACPADTRKGVTNWANVSRTNISYFISLNSTERTRNLSSEVIVTLSPMELPSAWHCSVRVFHKCSLGWLDT
ncbi:MAG TPA: hypothetical protein VM680_03575 [Verrucomicrobiae bacterium]|nr:hypothetical protein [Verrucomicrobiae bacterium]